MTATDTPAQDMPFPAQERAQEAVVWPEATVHLTRPIKGARGEEIRSITFREPDVEALEKIEAIDAAEGERLKIAHLRQIACALSGEPDAVVRRISATDFARMVEALAPFLAHVAGKATPSGP